MSTLAAENSDLTAEGLAACVGPIPLWRVRHDPPPGTAVEADVERVRREEEKLCELIDGVLVEKAVSDKTAYLAIEIATLLMQSVRPRRIGWVLGPNGFVRLFGRQLRAPDVSFVRRDQRPGGKLLDRGYADAAPALAVEIFSPGNTAGEMEQKRAEFFDAGTEMFWIVFPDREEIEVWTAPDSGRTLTRADTLEAGDVLPGFSVRVAEIFAAVDLAEPDEQG